MRKFTKSFTASLFLGAVLLFSSCKDDSYLLDKPQVVIDNSFTEEFDSYNSAIANGWVPINRSAPIGSSSWRIGSPAPTSIAGLSLPNFAAFSSNSTNNGFFHSNFDVAGFLPMGPVEAVINNWLISKPVIIKNGDKIIFYTRTSTQALGTESPDGLEVRVNPYNDGLSIGRISPINLANPNPYVDNIGDFTQLLLTVNKDLALNGALSFPQYWTKFELTVSGMYFPKMSRFAFRHFTLNGGPNNTNGTDIAIDKVSFISSK